MIGGRSGRGWGRLLGWYRSWCVLTSTRGRSWTTRCPGWFCGGGGYARVGDFGGAGPITVEFVGNHGFTDSFLHTASGDVTVCFTGNLPVTVHATSDMASGRGIFSDFSGLTVKQQGGDFSPKSMSAEGALNGGGPALRIRTTIGQIGFRRCQ